MKKYRHRITGDWVEKSNDHYYKLQADGRTIPVRLIENCDDWEEMHYTEKGKNFLSKGVKVNMKDGQVLTVKYLEEKHFVCEEWVGYFNKSDIESIV